MTKLSEELIWRGMKAQTTLASDSELDTKKFKFYLGMDPSADSITVGNLATLMLAGHLARHGHEPTLLIGGATGQIGDPKETGERDLKSLEEVEYNKEKIVGQFKEIIERTSGMSRDEVRFVDNYDWFKGIGYVDFLRDIGKHFSMTQLLDREFVKARIGEGASGISYAEFSYSLIQGYDFLHLNREFGMDMQVCGADQWGNCISGMQMIKKIDGKRTEVWSIPLVIDPVSGRKFGKSEGNAVWLAKERTNIFDFYQFWFNQSDEAVEGLLKIYTLLDKAEIEEVLSLHESDKSKRLAQRALAFGATKVVHGEKMAVASERATEILFDGKEDTEEDLVLLTEILPNYALKDGVLLVDALVESEMLPSKGEVRRLIKGNGLSLNGVKVSDENAPAVKGIVKIGKNKFLIIK